MNADIADLRAQILQLREEVELLHELLTRDRDKWGFEALVFIGRRLLDEVYPACVFDGSSGDSGPEYVVALRKAIARIDEQRPR